MESLERSWELPWERIKWQLTVFFTSTKLRKQVSLLKGGEVGFFVGFLLYVFVLNEVQLKIFAVCVLYFLM